VLLLHLGADIDLLIVKRTRACERLRESAHPLIEGGYVKPRGIHSVGVSKNRALFVHLPILNYVLHHASLVLDTDVQQIPSQLRKPRPSGQCSAANSGGIRAIINFSGAKTRQDQNGRDQRYRRTIGP